METTAPTPRHNWFIFILFLAMCILIWSLTSCGVLKNHYLHKYCQSKDSISYVENTIVDFDTIYRKLDGETIYINSPCDSAGILKPFLLKKKTNGITATVTSTNNVLTVDCDVDSLMVVNSNLVKTIKDFKHTTQQVRVNELTKLQGFWIITGQWLLGLLIAYILFRVFKGYLKSYFPFIK